MSVECIGQPVSWLRLEQLAAGELSAEQSARAREHIDACPACRQCWQTIREPSAALRPLTPAAAPAPATPWWRHKLAWGGLSTAIAGAAIVLVMAARGEDDEPRLRRRVAFKGDTVAMDVIRERDGSIAHTADGFRPDDRFKVVVTCSELELLVDVAVFQPGEVSFPLAPARVACGNRVPVPGAFRITGAGPAVVCAVLSDEREADRAAVRAARPAELANAACVELAAQ